MTATTLPEPRSAGDRASGASAFLPYLARKLAGAVASFIALLVVGYAIFNLIPSNPLEAEVRMHPNISPAQVAFLRQQMGLNESPLQRFGTFVANTLQGHFGFSWQYQEPVSSLLAQSAGPTLLLTGTATVLAIVVGMWLGIRGGWRPGSLLDRTSSGVSLAFWSMSPPWLGLMLLVLLPFFPSGGMSTPGGPAGFGHVLDVAGHMVLPCLTLTLVIYAQFLMVMRSSMVDELGSPYLLTARAKGLRDDDVRSRHAVPNAMLPTVTVIFMQLGLLVTGAITVESVFSWPGLGFLTYQALKIPDLPLLEGLFVVFGASVIMMNLLADIVYRFLDPRVRHQ
ncbi:MAG: ABC transporter permease [Streptosporangiales bacterium]|nr:ABC transporter permease [Streptosporangiales bacterium]